MKEQRGIDIVMKTYSDLALYGGIDTQFLWKI